MNQSLVIIPTYNEKENIEDIIRKVFSLSIPHTKSNIETFDVLIIDDNSPDGTAQIVKRLQKEFSNRLFLEQRAGKLGLGTAYIHGFHYALDRNYQYIFEMDADFSHNPEDLVRLHEACYMRNAHVAVGSRYIKGVNVVNWPMIRVLISYFASFYVRFITGMPVKDSTAGFKCYTRKVLETIELGKIKFVGYAFQIEMKFEAWKYGFKIEEVPIIFTDRTKGKSKMSSGIIKEAFFGVINMKISSFFKKYIKVQQ